MRRLAHQAAQWTPKPLGLPEEQEAQVPRGLLPAPKVFSGGGVTINIYRIVLEEGDLQPVSHYVMAESFGEAVDMAKKLHAHSLATWEDSEILSVEKKHDLEVVK